MTIFKHFFCLIFICLSTLAFGKKTTISGLAKDWQGKEVHLSIYSDYLSKTQETVSRTVIDSLGNFELSVDIDHTLEAWIIVNRFRAPIFLQPGKTYNISLRESPKNVLVDTWQKGAFEYDLLDLQHDDLNAEISTFDQDYYAFYVNNQAFIGTNKLKSQIDSFATKYLTDADKPFLSDYQNFALAEMKLGAGFKKSDLFESYISSSKVDISNPNSFRFFQLFFKNYFLVFDSKYGGAAIYNRLNTGLTPSGLDSLLQKDDFLQNKSLRQMVILNSVAEVISSQKYELKKLIGIVEYININAASDQVSSVSENLLKKLSDDKPQSIYNAISAWEPKLEYRDDEQYTMLFIANSKSVEYEKERMVIEALLEKYPALFVVDELDVSNRTEDLPSLWTRHNSNQAFEVLENLQIYGLPQFIWIDPAGEIDEMDLEKPSQGLEKRLFRIQSDRKESQKIQIGSKEN